MGNASRMGMDGTDWCGYEACRCGDIRPESSAVGECTTDGMDVADCGADGVYLEIIVSLSIAERNVANGFFLCRTRRASLFSRFRFSRTQSAVVAEAQLNSKRLRISPIFQP